MSDESPDRGLLLGEGVFETVLLLRGEPTYLRAHLRRMQSSAATLGLACPDDLEFLVRAAIPERWDACGRPPRAALRVTLTAGAGRGLAPPPARTPRIHVAVAPLEPVASHAPLCAVVVTAHRVDPAAAVSGHKTLSWMPWILARREALARGADVALVTTVDGDVCEADHANVFAVVRGDVLTPPLDSGVLPGITRARAIAVLRRAGRAIVERTISTGDLHAASEIWLTSSLDGVRAVAAIGEHTFDAPGSVTTWLADCVDDA